VRKYICTTAFIAISAWISITPGRAQTILGKNLVVNGDAESSPGAPSGTAPASITGWTVSGGPQVLRYSDNGRMSISTIGPANRGLNYFGGSDTAKASLTQKIDISAAASGIDAGTLSYDASGYIGITGGDTSSMIVTLQNASGGTITSFTFGPLDPNTYANGIYFQRKMGQVPNGTRSVTVEVDLARTSGSNDDATADNISFMLNSDASLAAGFSGSNLIFNGNAEVANGSAALGPNQYPQPALDIPGFVRSGGFSLDGYPDNVDLTPTDPGPPDRGTWYFYGGPGNPDSTAYQDIDVAGAAQQIDAGRVTFAFSGWVGGLGGQGDNMAVTTQFMNWAGTVLGSSTIGPVTDADRGGMSALLQKSQSGTVPAGTRMARVTMHSVRTDGGDNDGLADSLSLILTVPSNTGVTPTIQSGGVVTASAFGDFATIAPGTWMEIYGSNLAVDSRGWAGTDFIGSSAPTSLDGTFVTIGGQKAFISYISSSQVNAQVPSGVISGPQQLTVTTPNGASAAYTVTVNAVQPGLLAPPVNFLIGGKQYVAALHADGTFVLPPGSIAGLQTRQAQPGETILLYGVGFGNVTPASPAGQIVSGQNQLAQPLTLQFANVAATLQYDGLAPNYVGLYQFNVVVPSISDSDAVPLAFNLGGVQGSQTLYTAVKH
jgi:uncharacterized protein (TIGR03437 family)